MKWFSIFLITVLMITSSFASGSKGKSHNKMEVLQKELNLSPEQVTKLTEIRKLSKDDLKALKEKFKVSRKAVKESMKNPTQTKDELNATFEEFLNTREEFQKKRFSMMLEMRSVLNPEQIGKFATWKDANRGKRKAKKL
ncbi:MAG TPA: Spy/CpxP family protein refolding chaperone [Bacteriovoracaceae bacterium]|nr:Spy/CpxP family protein refolding chaperone [Bacteriovoracaceae bacterium]